MKIRNRKGFVFENLSSFLFSPALGSGLAFLLLLFLAWPAWRPSRASPPSRFLPHRPTAHCLLAFWLRPQARARQPNTVLPGLALWPIALAPVCSLSLPSLRCWPRMSVPASFLSFLPRRSFLSSMPGDGAAMYGKQPPALMQGRQPIPPERCTPSFYRIATHL